MITDSLAFLVIAVLAVRSKFKGEMSRILQKIVQDATLYFFVIFTSHFVLVMTLLLERVSISIVCGENGAEIPLAEPSALAGEVSGKCDTHQCICAHYACVTLICSGVIVCVLVFLSGYPSETLTRAILLTGSSPQ